jgi:Xaa-Pro aminopeptidase
MEYSPNCAIPYVSQVDGGTLELVRSCGVTVKSSADLLQRYTAVLDDEERESHLKVTEILDAIAEKGWIYISQALKENKAVSEYQVQQYILRQFEEHGCVTSDEPICAVNGNAANPHYAPTAEISTPIKKGDFVLLDIWCKLDQPNAIYGDICRVAVAAEVPTSKQQEIFEIVKGAREAATELVRERFEAKQRIEGWEVDQAARDVIEAAGYGDAFIHRTGHNIGTSTHGDGANMDNYETHDSREILPSTCFSIEPGIYIPGEIGVRLEYDVLVDPEGKVLVTGGIQETIRCLL